MKIKINAKKFLPVIIALLILIVVIVVVVKTSGNKAEEKQGDVGINPSGSQYFDLVSTEDRIYVKDTVKKENYQDKEGNDLSEEQVIAYKGQVKTELMSYPLETLQLVDIDLASARIMYNEGTTEIGGHQCLVFNVYNLQNDELNNVGMYAMSMDDSLTMYRFNKDTTSYDLLKK